jgi:hypothetical protein
MQDFLESIANNKVGSAFFGKRDCLTSPGMLPPSAWD